MATRLILAAVLAGCLAAGAEPTARAAEPLRLELASAIGKPDVLDAFGVSHGVTHELHDLTLHARAAEPAYNDASFLVGVRAFDRYLDRRFLSAGRNLLAAPPLRNIHLAPDLDLTNIIDYTDSTYANIETSIVRLLVPEDRFQPFIAAARQYNDLEDMLRLGVGGGVRWVIAPNVSFATEAILFGSGSSTYMTRTPQTEATFMSRLEVNF